jgi:membrane protease YdiL (CAAX protease family)
VPELQGRVVVSYQVRGRILLFYFATSLAVTGLIAGFWLGSLDQSSPAPLPDALLGLVFYGLLFACILRMLTRNHLPLREILGPAPSAGMIRWAVAAGTGLLGVSMALLYAVFLPLSYVSPEFVRWWLIDDPSVLIWTRGAHHQLANVVNFAVIVLVGPFVEELFFRGLLLPAWASRWNPTRALILSSLLFAVLHGEIVGAFIFGIVAGLAFLGTRGLWLPLIIHIVQNGLVWLIEFGHPAGGGTETLADFRESWWIGLSGLMVGLPLLLGVLRHPPIQLLPPRWENEGGSLWPVSANRAGEP